MVAASDARGGAVVQVAGVHRGARLAAILRAGRIHREVARQRVVLEAVRRAAQAGAADGAGGAAVVDDGVGADGARRRGDVEAAVVVLRDRVADQHHLATSLDVDAQALAAAQLAPADVEIAAGAVDGVGLDAAPTDDDAVLDRGRRRRVGADAVGALLRGAVQLEVADRHRAARQLDRVPVHVGGRREDRRPLAVGPDLADQPHGEGRLDLPGRVDLDGAWVAAGRQRDDRAPAARGNRPRHGPTRIGRGARGAIAARRRHVAHLALGCADTLDAHAARARGIAAGQVARRHAGAG